MRLIPRFLQTLYGCYSVLKMNRQSSGGLHCVGRDVQSRANGCLIQDLCIPGLGHIIDQTHLSLISNFQAC